MTGAQQPVTTIGAQQPVTCNGYSGAAFNRSLSGWSGEGSAPYAHALTT